MANLNAGTGQIANPSQYVSAEGVVYADVKTTDGCSDYAVITLRFYPEVVVNDATLRACTFDVNLKTASFNLTTASVTAQTGTTKNIIHLLQMQRMELTKFQTLQTIFLQMEWFM